MAGERTPLRTRRRRPPLSRERVLRAALKVADESGIEAVSMRRLGQVLRVEAMSLYRHVRDKEAVLDGLADLVSEEFELPRADLAWKQALRRSAISAHEALGRHPWAGPVLESRLNAGPARLRYLDAMVGALRDTGMPLPLAARAFMTLDSYVYGFAMQEQSMAYDAESAPDIVARMAQDVFAGSYPNLSAMAGLVATGELPIDFEFGLDLILDALEGMLPSAPGRSAS